MKLSYFCLIPHSFSQIVIYPNMKWMLLKSFNTSFELSYQQLVDSNACLRDKSIACNIASMKDMFELEEKRLQYRMRTSSRYRHLHENLFGRLALSSSHNFKSGRHFSKKGFLPDDDCTTLNATFCKTQFRFYAIMSI